METLERLEVELRLNREQFTKELGTIQGQLSGLTQMTNKTSNAVGGNLVGSMIKGNIATQLILGTVTKLANGVFNLTKNLMLNGSQLSRMKIATNTLARNMGITTEEIDGLRDSLAEANTYGINAENVIKTLAMSGLISMSKSLETVDGRTGETATGINALVLTMKDLGAVAGTSSSEAIERITRFINRGEAASVEGMIAIGNLGTEYRMFAKTLGKGRDELTAVEEAQARMNLVMREGEKALGAYADAYTTSGKMLDSIKDATQSLSAELGASLEPIWAALSSAVLTFVQDVRNFLVANADNIRAWATRVASYIIAVVRIIGGLLSSIPNVGYVFQNLAKFELKVAKGSQASADSTNNQAKSMDNATGSAKSLKKALAGLAQFDEMTVLKQQESGGGVGSGSASSGMDFAVLQKIAEDANKLASDSKDKIEGIVNSIKSFFEPIAQLWDMWVKPSFDGFLAVINAIFGKKNEALTFGDVLQSIFIGIVAIIAGAINVVTGLITVVAGGVKLFIEGWKLVFETVKNVWNGIRELIYRVSYEIAYFIVTKINEIKAKWEFLKTAVAVVFEYVKAIAQEKIENIKNLFTGIFDTAKNVFNNIKTTVSNIVGSLVDGVKDKIATMKQGFIDLGNKIVTSVKDPINQVIVKINSFLGKIRGINIAGLSLNIPDIPKLATGGVVNSPTIALLGEAGKEAVVPLENNTEWIDKLARELGGRNGGIINLTVQVGDEKIGERMIDYMNDKALRTGSNLLVM